MSPRPSGAAAALLVVAGCGGDSRLPMDPNGLPQNQDPLAVIAATPTQGSAPLAVELDASGSTDQDGEVVSYAWSLGDGATATGSRLTHVYEHAGDFTVSLTVTDEDGGAATTTLALQASEPPAGQVHGIVWFDRDDDGVRDAGEDGVAGITVYADGDGSGTLDDGEVSSVTDAGGVYRLNGLGDGEHTLSQVLPIGWTNTVPGPGVVGAAGPAPSPGGSSPGAPRRIIDGDAVGVGAFPFQVSLQLTAFAERNAAHNCGGTLIAPSWVLTAGHCIDPNPNTGESPEYRILVGTHVFTAGGVEVEVERLIVHPFYVPGANSFKRDMGLVELAQTFPHVPRVFLVGPDRFEEVVQPFRTATVIGWGRTVEGVTSSIPDTLQTIEIPVLADTECTSRYGDLFDTSMICAGFVSGGKSACQGDSGGPLMFPLAEGWYERES